MSYQVIVYLVRYWISFQNLFIGCSISTWEPFCSTSSCHRHAYNYHHFLQFLHKVKSCCVEAWINQLHTDDPTKNISSCHAWFGGPCVTFWNIICSSWSNGHCEWSLNPIIFWEMISHLTAGYRIYVKDPLLEVGFRLLNPAIEVAWESCSGKVSMILLCPSNVGITYSESVPMTLLQV